MMGVLRRVRFGAKVLVALLNALISVIDAFESRADEEKPKDGDEAGRG